MSTKQLKKENQELRDEVSKLTEKLDKFPSELLKTTSKTNEESRQDGRHDLPPDKQLTVEFVSDKYDDLLKELKLLKSRVDLISRRCEDISKAIEHMESYSYQYNIKITGMPLLGERESSEQTANLCLRLFRALGINDVSIVDIDITHRVPARRPSNKPNAIICKFTRRLAKEQVIAVRRGVADVRASQLGFESHVTLNDLSIYDHLTPRLQELHREAKKFKAERNYKFCWAKHGMVFLRKEESLEIVKLSKMEDLTKLQNE